MKKKDSGVRKLSEIHDREGIVPFLLAIAKGADINEKAKREPLIQTYYKHIRVAGDISREFSQLRLKKLKCLIALGADTKPIIRDDYQTLVLNLSRQLMLLNTLLGSDSAREAIKEQGLRLAFLKGLQQMLDSTSQAIADTGLVEHFNEVVPPHELWGAVLGEISEVTSISKLKIEEEDIAYLYGLNEKLELGLDPKDQHDKNDEDQG